MFFFWSVTSFDFSLQKLHPRWNARAVFPVKKKSNELTTDKTCFTTQYAATRHNTQNARHVNIDTIESMIWLLPDCRLFWKYWRNDISPLKSGLQREVSGSRFPRTAWNQLSKPIRLPDVSWLPIWSLNDPSGSLRLTSLCWNDIYSYIPILINYYIHYKVWNEVTYQFPNINRATVW